MNLNIGIGSVWMFGQMPPGGEGFVIEPDGLVGFDDGLGVRGDSVARPQAHGDFDVPTFFEPRIVAVSGHCLASSPEKLGWFRNQFKTLLVDGGRVQVDHLGSVMWGDARLAPGTQPKFQVKADSMTGRFQLQMKFANPRLFGESRTFGPARNVTAHQYGNFAATPVITVTGASAAGYTVWGPDGRKFGVTHPLVAGQPHTIDMATGLLRVGGQVVVGGVVFGQTWVIPPGVPVEMFTVDGSATLTVSVTDTFI